jgi:2-polyprenyl-6-methoxyphenol hydroxylase-like FAD-dependent oxidoreductase
MRVLIVGGGVAGLALAAQLARQGREPLVVEQASSYGEHGFSVSLYPYGSAVLHGIGAYGELAGDGVEMRTYEIGDGRGRVLRRVDFARLLAAYGPTYFTTHAGLIELLRRAGGDRVELRMGTTVSAVGEADGKIEATLSDGSAERFDLLAGCDGINSATRERAFGPQPGFDTGWVGWTWWAPEGIFPPETAREHWRAGALFGAYPTPGRTMCIVAVPAGLADPGAGLAETELIGRLRGALGELAGLPEVGRALGEAAELWPWRLRDVRSHRLSRGRLVLCGDAGTAFLPTAGVGASVALRCAAALGDELSRADGRLAPLAVELYVKRTAKAARANQRDSRRLARAMFVENGALAWGRERLIRHTPVRTMIGSILAAMRQPG